MEIIAQAQGDTDYVITNSTISGNSVTDGGTYGIAARLGGGNLIDDNTVSSNDDGDGFYIAALGDDDSITNNTVTSAHTDGIEVTLLGDTDNLDITGNTVTTTSNNGHGISFIGDDYVGTNVTINTNTITGTNGTGRGIYAQNMDDGSSITMSGNIITTAANTGLQLDGSGNSSVTGVITGNTVKNGSYYGIIVNGFSSSAITVSSNTIGASGQPNAHCGIAFTSITGGTLVMDSNTARYNTEEGICFIKSAAETGFTTATLTNNNASNNTKSGLYLQMGGGYVVGTSGNGNTFSNNTEYGILVNGADVASSTFAYNTISSNTISGIYMQNHGSGNTISNNTISNNSQNGILLADNSAVTVSSNTISSNDSASEGSFLTNFFIYTYDGDEYNDDGPDFMVTDDMTFDTLQVIEEDETELTSPDGTNDFNLVLLENDGSYAFLFVDAANIDSSEDADTACDALVGGDCTITLFLEDVFTANGASSDYTYDSSAVSGAGITITQGSSSPAWTYEEDHSYAGIQVTGTAANTLSGNTISGNGNGVKFSSSAVSQTVSDSVILSSLNYDVQVKATGTITIYLDNTTFTTYDFDEGDDTIDVNYDLVGYSTLGGTYLLPETVFTHKTGSTEVSMGTSDSTGYSTGGSADAYQITAEGATTTATYTVTAHNPNYGYLEQYNISPTSKDQTVSFSFGTGSSHSSGGGSSSSSSSSVSSNSSDQSDQDSGSDSSSSDSESTDSSSGSDGDQDTEESEEYDQEFYQEQLILDQTTTFAEVLKLFQGMVNGTIIPGKTQPTWISYYQNGKATIEQIICYSLWEAYFDTTKDYSPIPESDRAMLEEALELYYKVIIGGLLPSKTNPDWTAYYQNGQPTEFQIMAYKAWADFYGKYLR